MPSEAEFWRAAAEVVAARGGLVVGFTEDSDLPELGSTLDNVLGFTPPQPPTVVRASDWMDWTEQVELFYRLRPSWGRGKSGDPRAKYYRVKFPSLDGMKTYSSSISTLPPLDNRLAIPSFGGYNVPAEIVVGVSFWPRAAARLIDHGLHFAVQFLAARLFVFLLRVASGGHPPLWVFLRLSRAHIPIFAASVMGYVAYQVICTRMYGSSLGKLILSLVVVQEDGSPCRLRSAIIRELGFFVDSFFFGIVGYVTMRGNSRQQRLGDQWADTLVLKRASVAQSAQPAIPFVLALMAGVIADVAFCMVGLLVQMNW